MSANSFQSPVLQVVVNSIRGFRYEFTDMEMGGEILSFGCGNSVDNPAVGFQMVLVAKAIMDRENVLDETSQSRSKAPWYEILQPRALIDVYLNGIEVFMGIVETVRFGWSGEGVKTINVVGIHIGAVLKQFKVIWNRAGLAPSWTVPAVGRFDPGIDKSFSDRKDVDKFTAADAIQSRFSDWMDLLFKLPSNPDTKIEKRNEDYYEVNRKKPEQERLVNPLPPMVLANGCDIRDILVVRSNSTLRGGGALSPLIYAAHLVWSANRFQYEGDFWNFFMSCVTSPLNELFVDVGDRVVKLYDTDTISTLGENYRAKEDITTTKASRLFNNPGFLRGRAYVVLRPKPWDDRWVGITDLKTYGSGGQFSYLTAQDCLKDISSNVRPNMANAIAFTDEDIYNFDLVTSGANVSTCWQVMSALSAIDSTSLDKASPPIYDKDLTALYGHRPMVMNLMGIDPSKINVASGGIVSDYIWAFTKKLQDWFRWQDHYLEGTFVVPLNPLVRIGQWLWYGPKEDQEAEFHHRYYYVTAVTHSYSYENPKGNQTTISVVRGTPAKMLSDKSGRFTRQMPPFDSTTQQRGMGLIAKVDPAARAASVQRQAEIHRKVTNPFAVGWK